MSHTLTLIVCIGWLRCCICWVPGILLLPYLFKHLCRSVLVPVFHVGYQILIVFFEAHVEAVLLHQA